MKGERPGHYGSPGCSLGSKRGKRPPTGGLLSFRAGSKKKVLGRDTAGPGGSADRWIDHRSLSKSRCLKPDLSPEVSLARRRNDQKNDEGNRLGERAGQLLFSSKRVQEVLGNWHERFIARVKVSTDHYEEARTGVETASKAGHSFPGRGVKVPLERAGGYRLKGKGPKKKRSSKLQIQ